MKRLILALAATACLTFPAFAMADNIVCRDGWSIERHVTGSADSGFLSYKKDAGTIKLFHHGKLISQKRIQDIQQSVYQPSGSPLVNYEFDIDKDNFYILCSGQQKLATTLEFFQYRFSDSLGGNPPLYSCGLSAL
ncbi:hypothetical protein MUU47_00295 [Scandinavium sp. H11S7]|uniref:Uncharacterized protein n=1 Tax=Scandinavium hiltneri TaxID=2926519 RepID=A0ABT2DVP6_9ENTR|nr:hypothetical protein [Scandinavium hiltneri]MCS2159605.1 hypothetical protein [Scandinavium hiltneri]